MVFAIVKNLTIVDVEQRIYSLVVIRAKRAGQPNIAGVMIAMFLIIAKMTRTIKVVTGVFNMDLIARRLVQIEVMNSLSAQQMAKIMGIGESTYYRYRAGEGYPDWKMLDNLVSRFKISGGWLFDRNIV